MEENIQNSISWPYATPAGTVPKRKRGRPKKPQCGAPKRKRPEQTLDPSTKEMEENIQNSISWSSAIAAGTVPKRKIGRPKKPQCGAPKRKRPEQTLDPSTKEDNEPERFFKIDDMKETLRNMGEKLLRWIIEGRQTVDGETVTDMAKKIQKIEIILQERKERAENSKSSRQQKTLDIINPLLDSATYLTTVTESYLQNCSKKEQEDAHNLSFVDIFDDQSPENASLSCPLTPKRSILKTPNNDSFALRKKISFAEKVTSVYQDNETSQISLAKSSPSVKDALSNSDNNASQSSVQNAILDVKCQSYEETSAQLEQKNASINLSEDMFCDDSESIINSSFQNDSFSSGRNPSEIHLKRFTPKMSYQMGSEKPTTCGGLPTSGGTPETTQVSSKGNYSTFEFANQTLTNNREDSTNNIFSDELLNSFLSQISMKDTANVVTKPPQDITLPFHNFTLTLPNSSSEESLDRSVEMAINFVKGSEKAQSSETNEPGKTVQVDQCADWAWQRENSIEIVPGTEFFMGGASQWMEPQWNQHLNYNVHASQNSSLNVSLLFDETDQRNCGFDIVGGYVSNSSMANATNVPLSEGQIEYPRDNEVNKTQNAKSTLNSKVGSNPENQERQLSFGVVRQCHHELENHNLQRPFGEFDVQSYAQLNATYDKNFDDIYKEKGSRLCTFQETIISESKKQIHSVDSRQLPKQARDTSMDRRNTGDELESSLKQNNIDQSSTPTKMLRTRAGSKLLGIRENHNNTSFDKGGLQLVSLNPGEEKIKRKTIDHKDKIPMNQDSKMSVFDIPAQSESYGFKSPTSLSIEYGNNQKKFQKTRKCGKSKSNMAPGAKSVENARGSSVLPPNRNLLSTQTSSHEPDKKEVTQDTKTRYEETLLTGNWLKPCLQQSTTRSFPSITDLESMKKSQNSKPEHLDESDAQFEVRKSEDIRLRQNTSTTEISQNTDRKQSDLYANSSSSGGQVINAIPPLYAIHSWTNNAPETEILETDTQQSILKFKTKAPSGTMNLRPGSILSNRNSFQGQRDWIKDTMLAEKNSAQQSSDHKSFPSQTPLDDTVQVQSKTIESRQDVDIKKSKEGLNSQEVLDGEEAIREHGFESRTKFVKYDTKSLLNTLGLQNTLGQDRSMNEMLLEDACPSTKMEKVPLLQNYKPIHHKGSSTKSNNVGKENTDDTAKGNIFQLTDVPRYTKREEASSTREALFQNAALERSLAADTTEKSQGTKHVFVRPSEVTKINKKTKSAHITKSTAKGPDQDVSEQLKQNSNSRKRTIKNENMKVPRNFPTPNISESTTPQLQNYSIQSMNKLEIGRNTRQSHLGSIPTLSQYNASSEQESSDVISTLNDHPGRISGTEGISFENSAFVQDQDFSVTDAEKYERNYQGSDIIYEECDNLSWASDDYNTNPAMDSFSNKNPNSRSSTPSEEKNIQTTEKTDSLQTNTPKMTKAQAHEDHNIIEYEAHTQLSWGLSATCEIPAYPSSNLNSNESPKTTTNNSKIEKKKQVDEDDFMEYQVQTQLSWGLSATCEIPAYPASIHKSSNSAAATSSHTSVSSIKYPDNTRTTNNKELNRFKCPIAHTLSAYSNQALSFTEFMRDIQVSSTEQCEDSPIHEIPIESNQSVKTEQEEIDEILNGIKYVRVPPESELIPAADINELINDLTFVW